MWPRAIPPPARPFGQPADFTDRGAISDKAGVAQVAEAQYIPTPDDLTPWGKRAFERAYQDARARHLRPHRDSFAAGYLAALVDCRAWSQFSDEARQRLSDSAPGTDPGPAPRRP
jgi:hypothetical protein